MNFPSRRAAKSARIVASIYLALVTSSLLFACAYPGPYYLNFLLPFILTAPTSMGAFRLASILGWRDSIVVGVGTLLACGIVQALVLYVILRRVPDDADGSSL
jgi:hypothetical protein